MSSDFITTYTVTAVNAATLTVSGSVAAATGLMLIRKDAPYRAITPAIVATGTATVTDADCSDYTRFQIGDILAGGGNPGSTVLVPL
jgi:hypothetical protein